MSQRNGRFPKLDLMLNLSPPRVDRRMVEEEEEEEELSPARSATVSPPSSCVSTELNNNNQDENESVKWSDSPEATFMVVVGCQRCLMYVMLSVDDPKCPKCKSTVLLDVLQDHNNINNNTNINIDNNNSRRNNN
ncbi:Protein GL2-INTERACTING REPRESSOR 1 [Stylosanthes scabra]|uniref:Protein GL2-INTERACTING REPRESSOR 1 n=1 Tax=Stylosanthes scabra TaxID=79078 RepID=A0ABU6WE87_9FABA|nr:Protein GL2-INTERACTING REPRESSOR 1 [Stylosanthes scabra]